MMKRLKIPDDSGNGSYTIYEVPDFEYVDPIKHFAEIDISMNISMLRDMILLKKAPIPLELIEKYIYNEANKDWIKKLKEIEETLIPDNLISILNTKTKKEQIKLTRCAV